MGGRSSLDIMTILFEYEDAKTGAAVGPPQPGHPDSVRCLIVMQIGSVLMDYQHEFFLLVLRRD